MFFRKLAPNGLNWSPRRRDIYGSPMGNRETFFRKSSLLVLGVVLLLIAGAGVLLLTRTSARGNPAWVGDRSDCPSTPLTHVHDPKRIRVLSRCSTVTGRVQQARVDSAYDDLKITVLPDANFRSYLRPENKGVVVADVIATQLPQIAAPPVGSEVVVSGAWVFDKASKSVQLLPVYRLVVGKVDPAAAGLSGHSVERHGPPVVRTLRFTVATAKAVVVGNRLSVAVKATWLTGKLVTPASQVRLFAEMTTADGTGVRWKAAMTDVRGLANINLVTIQVPAAYKLTVYAAEYGQPISESTQVQVKKR